jgi:ABC-type nickel/cobalt efflux system permease component RcnA
VLESALLTGDLQFLIWTAATLGFAHAALGPDHYLPFVMMARAERWSCVGTTVVTLLCGIGHVASSAAVGALLVVLGMKARDWSGTPWATLHAWRGAAAAWALMGLGVAYLIWGLVRAKRGRAHTHLHAHENRTVHRHPHSHTANHLHAHVSGRRSITPWILFTIFLLGPCEALIPLMLAAWALSDLSGMVWVIGAFSVTTVVTMVACVAVLLAGVSRLPFSKVERHAHAIAGLSLALCGAGMRFLGL